MPFRRLGLVLCLAFALLLPACTSSNKTTRDEPEPLPQEPAEPGNAEPDDDEAPRARTVQGFRIQVLTTEDKAAANQRAAEAESAWGQPVEVAWKAPYYRVRLGAFASRADAQSTLAAVQEQYPGALLVPDTVTIHPN